jgi:hypothetical protein
MDINIRKVLFYDIETVGRTATFDDFIIDDKRMSELWRIWNEKYKESNGDLTPNELWAAKAGLHAEYGKLVCVSFGYYDADMELKLTSFHGHNEKDILIKCAGVMNNADKKGMYLGGHTITRFDNIFTWKRMLAHGITPPNIINVWDKKPWDLKFFDIVNMWGGGSWKDSFTSLDTMAAVFGVASPKDGIKNYEVHDSYWHKGLIEQIKSYCEGDVRATAAVGAKMLSVLNQKELKHESAMY